MYAIASGICILALIIVLLYSSFGEHGSLWGIVFVLIPFIIFYAIVPFFVRLEPCKDKSAVNSVKEKSKKIIVGEAPAEHKKSKNIYHTQNTQNPIELDVSDDFSARFMKTKSNLASTKPELSEEDRKQMLDISSSLEIPEDIFSGDLSKEITDD